MLTPDTVHDPSLYPIENPNPVFRVGADGLLLFANRAADDLLAAWGTSVGSSLPDEWRQRIAEALTSGQRQCISVPCGDRIYELDLVPILGHGYVNVYGRDVTGQEAAKRAREALLAESEERARDLIRYAPTGIYEVDFRTGRFRSVNDAMCTILGYSRDELMGMSAFDLLDDEGRALFAERIRRTLTGQEVDRSVEYRVRKKDGSVIYGVLSVRITHHDGQQDGAFVIAHDITERRRAAEELRLAAETLEQRVRERTAELAQTNVELSQSRQQMQVLSHRLIEAAEEERRVVTRELHDQANQLLTALTIGLHILEKRYDSSEEASRHITYLQQIGDDLSRCMHDLAVSLRPACLDRVGLAPALQQLTEMFESQAHLRIDLITTGLHERLGPDVETAIYRIVQEALNNTVRHAQATRAGVVVQRHDGHVSAIIEDDGKGFDVDDARRAGRMGLTGMRERVEMLNGTLTIETSPGGGTTILVDLPCPGTPH